MIRWIASYPKSGNTWLRLFLKAYVQGDQFSLNERLEGHLQDTDKDYNRLVSPVPVEELSGPEQLAIRGAALVHMLRVFGTPYVKTHCANITLDWQGNLIPVGLTERAVYIMRDPRDVVVSYADHGGKTIDETIARLADVSNMVVHQDGRGVQPLTSWSKHVQSWTREMPFPVFITSYEYLHQDPVGTFRALLEFLGWPVNEDMLQDAVVRVQFAHLAASEQKDGFWQRSPHQKKFFRQGTVGGWRDVLTKEQASKIEADHGDMMREWNYLDEGEQHDVRAA